MPVEWRVGDRIYGRWWIRQVLLGGMGQVYVVYDEELGEVLAAKTFQDGLAARHGRLSRYFSREVHTWLHLDAHPHVTRARFVEKVEGKPFLFLEHVSGGSLREWIGTQRLTQNLPQVLRFAVHFCDGMAYVASKGIRAHRDVKPSNCLVTEARQLKVTDFGLATPLDAAGDGRPEAADGGQAEGTWAYMAPERFHPPYTADLRGDLYSFGVMLYLMLVGRLPFVARTRAEWAWKHLRYAPASPAVFSDQPAAVRQVVRTCLAKDPAERYADFVQVRQALAEAYEELTGELLPEAAGGSSLDAASWTQKGASLAVLGRHQEALVCYARALELDPESPASLTHQGVSQGALGWHDRALASFSRALARDANHLEAWIHRGLCLTAQGRPEQALHGYQVALTRDRHCAQAWLAQGMTQAVLERRDQAIASCARAVELNAWLSAAWTLQGRLHLAEGDTRVALWCAAQALERDPWHLAAWCLRGLGLAAGGRHAEAVTCYGEALVRNQTCVAAWVHRGISTAAQQAHGQALSLYRRALRLEPRCVVAWVHRGRSQAALGRTEAAVASFDHALELDRRCVAAWVHRAAALMALGRPGEALVCCNRALRLAPRSADAWLAKGKVLEEGLGRGREADGCLRRARAAGLKPLRGGRLADEPEPPSPLCCIEPYLRPCDCSARLAAAGVAPDPVGPAPASPAAAARNGDQAIR
ncbi:MAG: tetratricopeptide repeat protein [Candidatus Latescibacterota bacterium]